MWLQGELLQEIQCFAFILKVCKTFRKKRFWDPGRTDNLNPLYIESLLNKSACFIQFTGDGFSCISVEDSLYHLSTVAVRVEGAVGNQAGFVTGYYLAAVVHRDRAYRPLYFYVELVFVDPCHLGRTGCEQ